MAHEIPLLKLCDIGEGELADCFALLTQKEPGRTRDQKPYFRLQFRDARRTVAVMIWHDSVWFELCEQNWKVGQFFKLRARFQETQYGPQLELANIREVEETDTADGFSPFDFFPASRFDISQMFAELVGMAQEQIADTSLRTLVVDLLNEHAELIQRLPAATRNHHTFTGGYLEHVLSVTRTALYLADKYSDYYRNMQPPLSKSLVIAGAILHDIGKVQELDYQPQQTSYSPSGKLIGHILLGRDLVREKARTIADFDPEILLRLEHIIVAHQNLPEWGSPIAPHTPEALLVHYADEIDAKFHMMATALEAPADDELFTGRDNPLRRAIFRGWNPV
ncbi:MAG: HD domain-containing protein [Planctomycetota bacterium]|nr:HD domain-containing protein [Planctomycetota bacterium]MDA1212271.1 HD domain-containing protein [Planctomycetota bacterium]